MKLMKYKGREIEAHVVSTIGNTALYKTRKDDYYIKFDYESKIDELHLYIGRFPTIAAADKEYYRIIDMLTGRR